MSGFIRVATVALALGTGVGSAMAVPNLIVESCAVRADTCALGGAGNRNGTVDPGETIGATLALENRGTDATNVTAVVSTSTPGVTITQPNTSFGNIPAGGGGAGSPTFDYMVDASVACGTDLVFQVQIMSTEGTFSGSCTMRIPSPCDVCSTNPVLSVDGCNVRTDSCSLMGPGHANGRVDPGESSRVALAIRNSAVPNATGVQAIVTTATPGVTITQGMVAVGTVMGGSVANPPTTVDFDADLSLNCGDSIVLDIELRSDQGNTTDTCGVTIPAPCNPCTDMPMLAASGCEVRTDTCAIGGPGHNNGMADPGESVAMTLSTTNTGIGTASNVSATVTTATPGVTITQGMTVLGDIPSLATVNGMTQIEYTVDLTVPCGRTIVFDIEYVSDQGNFTATCTNRVPTSCNACAALVGNCGLTGDTCVEGGPGDNNMAIDPGETGTIQLRAQNQTAVASTTVTAIVTSPTPGVVITQPNATFGTVPAMGSAPGTPDIGFRVGSAVPCGTMIQFDIAFMSDQGPSTASCIEAIPVSCDPCVSSSCLVANLLPPTQLKGVRQGTNAVFQWLPDPGDPPAYHLNTVTSKTFLLETDPNSPRLLPTGMGSAKCMAVGPATSCTDMTGDTTQLLFYQVLSACGDLGVEEGPVCPVAFPCP